MKLIYVIPSKYPEKLYYFLRANKRQFENPGVIVKCVVGFDIDGSLPSFAKRYSFARDIACDGNVSAHIHGVQDCVGDFYVTLCDDLLLDSAFTKSIIAALKEIRPKTPVLFGLRTPGNIPLVDSQYYAWFPVFSRGFLEEIGHFDPILKSHFADVDLSLRALKAGISVSELRSCRIFTSPTEWGNVLSDSVKDDNFQSDFEYFKKKHGYGDRLFRDLIYEIPRSQWDRKNNKPKSSDSRRADYTVLNKFETPKGGFSALKKVLRTRLINSQSLTKIYVKLRGIYAR